MVEILSLGQNQVSHYYNIIYVYHCSIVISLAEWTALDGGVRQSTHENDVFIFLDDEQERMTCVELDGLDVALNVFQIVVRDADTCRVKSLSV